MLVLLPILLACAGLPVTPAPTARPLPTKTASLVALTPEPPPPPEAEGAPFDLPWGDLSVFAPALADPAEALAAELEGASIYHIALSLNDPPSLLAGIEEVRYTNREGVPLEQVSFAVFPEILGGAFQLDGAWMDGEAIVPRKEPGFLHFDLPDGLAPGQALVFRLSFRVSIPSLGAGAYYGIFGYNDGLLSLAHVCPTILVYDPAGWHDQLPDLDGDPLFSDASFYLVSVQAAAGLVLVGSGTELARDEQDGRQRLLLAAGPARDFYLGGSRDLLRLSEESRGLTVNSYYLPGDEAAARLALTTAQASLDLFSDRFGPYPYREFDILPITTSAGGVEYPGLTAVNREYYPGVDPFLEVVVAHEVSHQWFFNLVGNDTQGEPWLDESLTQFNTCQYYQEVYSEAAGQSCLDSLQSSWQTASDGSLPIGLPVSAYPSNDYSAIVYGKGAFFFEALRQKLGTSTYAALLREYVGRTRWGIGSGTAFQALAKGQCGCDLEGLFEQWVLP